MTTTQHPTTSRVEQRVSGGALPAAQELAELAVDAYLYGYPLVLMDITQRVSVASGAAGPVNQFAHLGAFPDPSFTAVVRPNADTLYSTLWFDVAREPLVIGVPDSGGRYYLLQLLDMWTDVFASIGKRTTGTAAQTFAIVGPEWDDRLPDGLAELRSPTSTGWLIGRTQTNGQADYANVHDFQRGLSALPLEAWGRSYQPRKRTVDPGVSLDPPVAQVVHMDTARFFDRFVELLHANPPHANDYPMLARLARLGIIPGKPFAFANTTGEIQAALNRAPEVAHAKLEAQVPRLGDTTNGWSISTSPIGTYGTDYLTRAVVALVGLGANTAEDALYPSAFADAAGRPFDSGRKYRLHFDKDQIPPARAFWSLTMYDDRELFADNPIDRYAIGDRDDLEFGSDGSLDLIVQRESPGKELESNWLPAPAAGGFTMNLRLYWPAPAALDGSWLPPAVQRVG